VINKSDWNLVAQEIETVIYGGNSSDGDDDNDDDDDDDDDGYQRRRRRRRRRRTKSEKNIRIGRGEGGRKIQRRQLYNTSNSINSYNLFDDHHHHQGSFIRNTTTMNQHQHQHQHQRQSSSSSSIIIYAQKYFYSPGSLFLSISIFLSVTSILLLIIRVVISLLTATVGIIIAILLIARILYEFISRPIRLIRTVHTSPIFWLAFIGAVFGTLHALWNQQQHQQQQLLPLLSSFITKSTITTMDHSSQQQQFYSTWWFKFIIGSSDSNESGGTATTATDTSRSSSSDSDNSVDSSYIDLVMLWGLIRGFVFGIEVGSLWLIVLGDNSNPTNLTKSFYRRVWIPLRRYHRNAIIIQRQTLSHFLAPSSIVVAPAATATASTMAMLEEESLLSESERNNDRQQCAICLEDFSSIDEQQQDCYISTHYSAAADHSRYQLLPCLHCFHRECAMHWLTIQNKCPICRVPVQELHCYDDNDI
jgi:hypothetical protein